MVKEWLRDQKMSICQTMYMWYEFYKENKETVDIKQGIEKNFGNFYQKVITKKFYPFSKSEEHKYKSKNSIS